MNLKPLFCSAIISVFLTSCIVVQKGKDGEPGKPVISATVENTKNTFNQKLADSLGADHYGMKNYLMVILKTGENDQKITDKTRRKELFKSHFENMKKLSDEGKLVVAGPYGDNQLHYRGMFIFNSSNQDDVKNWLQGDLTIKERIFDYEILPYYGSAALPMHLKYHQKIAKENP